MMQIDGDRFTLSERSGAFAGSGTLAGEPWHWTSWSSTSQIAKEGIEVESDDELTPVGLKATKQIRMAGKVLATTTEELATFDCADWDKVVAALAVPALDHDGGDAGGHFTVRLRRCRERHCRAKSRHSGVYSGGAGAMPRPVPLALVVT